MAPSDDLWLAAHLQDTQIFSSAEAADGTAEEITFKLDHPVSVLACIEQYQICNPSPLPNATSACTSWLSAAHAFDATREEISVLNTDRQWNTSQILVQSMVHGSFYSTIFFLASPQLLADSLTSGDGASLPLASDQWILEAKNFFTIGLANAQRLVVEAITGPPSQFTQYAWNETKVNEHPSMVWLCESLIIRRSDYTNFSTLAISLIFGLGSLVIGTSLCLETVVGLVRSKWRRNRWRQRAWWAEGTLQLQRRAFEGMGIKGWQFGEWEKVPLMGEKRRVWSALGNWDEMLPFVEEKKVQGKKAEKMVTTSSIQEFTALSQQNSGTRVSPVVSNSESPRDVKRSRSNSV
jgi:hypothetical protein